MDWSGIRSSSSSIPTKRRIASLSYSLLRYNRSIGSTAMRLNPQPKDRAAQTNFARHRPATLPTAPSAGGRRLVQPLGNMAWSRPGDELRTPRHPSRTGKSPAAFVSFSSHRKDRERRAVSALQGLLAGMPKSNKSGGNREIFQTLPKYQRSGTKPRQVHSGSSRVNPALCSRK